MARGLMSLGVGPTGNVAILSGNRPEWFLACLGTAAAGGVPAGIYVTSAPEQCEYIARHCQAAVVVLEKEAHRATLDDEGFLHSGDIGELDEAGYLKITDRKRELLVTSGGKKTGPAVLESRLKQLPAVAQAVVVGDGRHYLGALFTLDPLQVAAVAATAGSPARDVHAAATCPVFRTHLEAALASANLQFARFETVKRFVVLPVEFTVGGGELTPTLKLKRRVIYEKYAAEIERLYS